MAGLKIWLCDLTHTYQMVATDKMPLGVGMIASYVNKHMQDQVFFKLIKFLDEIPDNIDEDSAPDIIGFSN